LHTSRSKDSVFSGSSEIGLYPCDVYFSSLLFYYMISVQSIYDKWIGFKKLCSFICNALMTIFYKNKMLENYIVILIIVSNINSFRTTLI